MNLTAELGPRFGPAGNPPLAGVAHHEASAA